MPRMASGICAIAAVLFSAVAAQAQEVRWRPDYAAARKEAAATGKPMLLDFGSENCSWCRKLDSTTFRDRSVIELLNDRFIPVKVDGLYRQRLDETIVADPTWARRHWDILRQSYRKAPYFEAVALRGTGVFDTLKVACKLVLKTLG